MRARASGALRVGLALSMAVMLGACAGSARLSPTSQSLKLPEPTALSVTPLDEALRARRSIRDFRADGLDDRFVGQLLWAAQGVTSEDGRRTAPSAGALYPLELYVVTGEGVFHYLPAPHALVPVSGGDLRRDLAAAALGQDVVRDAPLVIVVTAELSRTAAKYGVERGERYVHLEAGHAAQNVLLEAVALGLGAVPVGAFDDASVSRTLGLPSAHAPLYLIAIGRPR